MNETELVNLYRDWIEFYWGMVEFFVGMSFAVIVGFFMAGQQMKRVVAIFAMSLYAAFSIVQIWLITIQANRMEAIRSDLAALYEGKNEIPNIVATIIEPALGKISPFLPALYIAILLGTVTFAYFYSADRNR